MKKALLAAVLSLATYPVFANPDFSVGTTIYGDPRPTNPGGIEATVAGDVFGDTVQITVDLSPMETFHPDVLLQEFYFNLVAPASQYTVVVDDPSSWNVFSEATVSGAGAGASSTFLFEASGILADRPDVDNPLVFTITKNTGDLIQTDFTGALSFNSSDVLLGGGSVGGKFQSLNTAGCAGCDDSGFALGDWGTSGGPDPRSASAPGHLALLSLGLIGLVLSRRRMK